MLDKRDIRTAVDGDVVVKLVDTGGTNVAGVDASNNLQVIGAANSGVDIGDVTINNAAGASAVNIQDGGNSITVDGTVTATNPSVIVDDAAFTPATDSVTMLGGFFDDVTPDSVNEGDAGAIRMSANRNLYSTIRDAAGNERGANVTAGGSLNVLDDNSAAMAASLSVLDDWDETNRAAVNLIAGQVGVQGGSGVVTALTQRVVLATDVALPTGTNSIGAVTQATHDNFNANANLQVGNADVTGTNPVPVTITNVEPSGTTAVAAQSTTASLAAQASETEEFALGTDVTGTLQSVTIAADVAWKAVVQKVDETPTTTTIVTLYGEPGATVQWQPRNPKAALHEVASDGTPTAKYQVVCTNNGISGVGGSGAISVHLEHDETAN